MMIYKTDGIQLENIWGRNTCITYFFFGKSFLSELKAKHVKIINTIKYLLKNIQHFFNRYLFYFVSNRAFLGRKFWLVSGPF